MSFIRQHSGAVVWSVALHIAIVAALGMTIRIPVFQHQPVAMAPIQGVIIDGAAIEREQKKRDDADRAERQRVERAERQRREAVETARREKAAEEKREQERVAEQKRIAEQERIAVEKKREEERVAEQKRKEQEARERQEREAAAKREAEAKRKQQQAEAELQAALATEGERLEAERNGLLDEYIRMIENQIVRHWIAPLSVKPGLDCVVNVVQLPTGDVVDVKVASCNGDAAVVRSIERAVLDASPLPKPPVQSLFERNLRVRFNPEL